MNKITRNKFISKDYKDIHSKRNILISKAHPEIKDLFGPSIYTFYYAIFIVFLHLMIAYFIRSISIIPLLFIAYSIGGILSQNLFLINHDLSHNLAFRDIYYNKILAIFCNIPSLFPYALIFKQYHIDHHRSLGSDIDSDIPLEIEAKLFTKKLGKIIWYSNQILFYALRPMLIKPIKYDRFIYINIICINATNILLYYIISSKGILYLLLSFYFAGGLHPVSAHFISEHYILPKDIELCKKTKLETYSYYGIMNLLTFNVGYHIEHHDFPNIASINLPKLRQIAPEYYTNIPIHKSWLSLIYQFIMDDAISLFNRIKI